MVLVTSKAQGLMIAVDSEWTFEAGVLSSEPERLPPGPQRIDRHSAVS